MVLTIGNVEIMVNEKQILEVLVIQSKGKGFMTQEGNKILSAIR
jgi:hypothetical protein